MAVYDLYGFLSEDIDRARSMLESSLGIRFAVRESNYQGGEYLQWGKTNDEHFVLKRNVDYIDGDPAEMSFPVHKILFYVNDTPRSADLKERLNRGAKDFVLLRHEDME
jgi:hypothetical protein